jgi:hypothetical protein
MYPYILKVSCYNRFLGRCMGSVTGLKESRGVIDREERVIAVYFYI